MTRRKKLKSVLNQENEVGFDINEETPETTPEMEEAFEKALDGELPTIEEIEAEEKENQVESPAFEDDGQESDETPVKKIVESKPTKEQLMSLSKSGLRFYQRTGKLPR
jgi:hypothetical protein